MYIKIDTTPLAKKESVIKKSEDSFEIKVKEPAEANRANKRVLEIMRTYFPKARIIKIISGHRSRKKILSIE